PARSDLCRASAQVLRSQEIPVPAEGYAKSSSECGQAAVSGSVYGRFKFLAEWCAAVMFFIMAIPLVGLLATMVKLGSRGPAFYSQIRLGRHGRPYRIYKLRTMTHNCEAATGPVWACADDPRVTRLGRVLRDTHLDELP